MGCRLDIIIRREPNGYLDKDMGVQVAYNNEKRTERPLG
jgi:hypothetical protein